MPLPRPGSYLSDAYRRIPEARPALDSIARGTDSLDAYLTLTRLLRQNGYGEDYVNATLYMGADTARAILDSLSEP